MERIVQFIPAYDKRSSDPSKNYGIHDVTLRMILKGSRGATQFVLYTNWQLPHVQTEIDSKPFDVRYQYMFHKPFPADIGYHSPVPTYEGQTSMDDCDVLDGKKCYYDGSSLQAEEVFKILCAEGSDGVWRELERRYNEFFPELPREKQE